VTDDFIGRLTSDPMLRRFFDRFSTDSQARIRQLVVDQLCAAIGGPCAHPGRPMKTAHAGAGISAKDWNASIVHLTATLERCGVPPKGKAEVWARVARLKPAMVDKPSSGRPLARHEP